MARTNHQAVGVRGVENSGDWRAVSGHCVVRRGAAWTCLRGAVVGRRFCGGGRRRWRAASAGGTVAELV